MLKCPVISWNVHFSVCFCTCLCLYLCLYRWVGFENQTWRLSKNVKLLGIHKKEDCIMICLIILSYNPAVLDKCICTVIYMAVVGNARFMFWFRFYIGKQLRSKWDAEKQAIWHSIIGFTKFSGSWIKQVLIIRIIYRPGR